MGRRTIGTTVHRSRFSFNTTPPVPTMVGIQSATPPADPKARRKKYTRPGNVPDAGAVSVQGNGALMRAKAGEQFASGETMRAIAEDIGVTLEVVEGWHRRDGWAGLRRRRP